MPTNASNTFGTSKAKRTYHNKRRPRYRGKKKYYKKLFDTKINTAVEVRMQEIAEKTVNDNIQVLTKRNYLFCNYDKDTNEFSVMEPRQDLMDWTGKVFPVSIPKSDIVTILNDPPDENPLSMELEADNGNGFNQLMVDKQVDGRRNGEVIYVRSLSAQIRTRSFQLSDTDINVFQTIKVKYAFVLWTAPEGIIDDPAIPGPTAIELLRLNPWGYKKTLDHELNKVFNGQKSRVLCQGETTLNVKNDQTSERYSTIYKKFKKPIMIQYEVDDQNGEYSDKKIYFVVRSTVPAHEDYDGIKPSLFACLKINYHEP